MHAYMYIQPQEPCDQQQLVTCKLLADWPVQKDVQQYLPWLLYVCRCIPSGKSTIIIILASFPVSTASKRKLAVETGNKATIMSSHTTWHVLLSVKLINYNALSNYSTWDCTLIILSADPEMMIVSLTSTANTESLCPLSVVRSVMSVGDLIFHTTTVLSCRHKHTHPINDAV